MKKLLYISLILIFSGSCKDVDDLFKSYGPETTEIRNVGDFIKITAGDKFDITLICDSAKAGTVEMTAGKNVIDGYTSKVNNGELVLSNDNKFNWVRKLQIRQKVKIYFKTLSQIQINGSAKFVCADSITNNSELLINHGGLEDADIKVNGDYVYVNCSNTGGVNIKGKCFMLSCSVDDISFISALNLNADKCYISSFSKADSYVNANSELGINLYGSGNIYYSKTPNGLLKVEDKGDGNIIQL